ncbi:MAG TPA: 1,4-dihydroxy-2-naphthoate polyprenyltransferase [Mycobacteriales bacterium]|nr:1,4-dihydroxy-2-naphthoate polyprenyltransferase [Mycobacteriales bacterium]
MTTAAQWVAGARPRTLPAAVAPVLVGTGAAVDPSPVRALLALVVALALQVGVNYANDYSDGVRGTDADRVGPLRLVGSGAASPAAVKRAALLALGTGAVAGLVLSVLSAPWLVLVGAACLAAAWGYTGTARPYGYRGLGEVSVFVFFGLVAVCGTAFVQGGRVTAGAVLGAVAMGALACAVLVVNNLRDLPTDAVVGKRTLAVVLGDAGTRRLYAALVAVALVVPLGAAAVTGSGWPLLGLLGGLLATTPLGVVLAGAQGRDLVPVLGATGRAQLVTGALLGLGLLLA